MLFDFHTHNKHIGSNGIYNFRIGIDLQIPDKVKYFTAGIHPWDVENTDINSSINQLKDLLQHPYCVGLGEVGLDKHFGTNLDLQIDVLKQQIELYQKSSKKVLIIHCIKSFQEIIALKKNFSEDLIWIFHAFNGSKELIESLAKSGFYFSIGELLFKNRSKISKSLSSVPLNHLFFETDEANKRIEEIYRKAAEILNISVSQLEKQLWENLQFLLPSLNG